MNKKIDRDNVIVIICVIAWLVLFVRDSALAVDIFWSLFISSVIVVLSIVVYIIYKSTEDD